MNKLSLGRIVHYVLREEDVKQINRRRVHDAAQQYNWPKGAQAHVGEPVSAGQILPMIVVGFGEMHVDPNLRTGENSYSVQIANGQVFLNGNDTYWVRMVPEGEGGGTWHWPDRT